MRLLTMVGRYSLRRGREAGQVFSSCLCVWVVRGRSKCRGRLWGGVMKCRVRVRRDVRGLNSRGRRKMGRGCSSRPLAVGSRRWDPEIRIGGMICIWRRLVVRKEPECGVAERVVTSLVQASADPRLGKPRKCRVWCGSRRMGRVSISSRAASSAKRRRRRAPVPPKGADNLYVYDSVSGSSSLSRTLLGTGALRAGGRRACPRS